jgi:hypothetical protein
MAKNHPKQKNAQFYGHFLKFVAKKISLYYLGYITVSFIDAKLIIGIYRIITG